MAASRSRRPVCGLIITQNQKPVPLKDVSIEAEIKGCVLGLKSVLKYINDSPDPIEVLFRFPLEDSSAVVGLTAIIDGRKIKAEIKEKEKARADYDDAIASGQSAALGEEKTGDIFSISLGNLPPQKDAEIHLQVVSELQIDAEDNVRFPLSSVLKPRYTPAGSSDPLAAIADEGSQVSSGRVAGFSGFQLYIANADCIAEVTSPTHTLNRVDSSGRIGITLTDQKPADKDLVILIKHKEPHQPSTVVEEGDGKDSGFMSQKAVMVNFFPDFEKLENDCEFIFLVDRSGSMGGAFIKSASETLILFMKSLPENCHFNIIGFGSRYEQLFPDVSVPYSQVTLDKAVAHLTGLQANLGGTELLSPLDFIFRTKPSSGLSRQVFVLTDGAVSNTTACIQKVKQNEKHARCFTFGIGSGASTALVEGLAKAGNGSAEFVKEGERLQPKVIRSLKRALQPAVTDVSLEFKVDGRADVLQCPQTLPPIFSGEKLVAYGVVKSTSDHLTGKAILKGKLLGKAIKETLPFASGPEVSSVKTIHHLAAKALIKDWQTDGKGKDEIVKLSIEASVISSHTAFIAVDEENSKPIKGALKTWDVQTHTRQRNYYMASAPMMRGFSGGGRGGGGGALRKCKKKGSAPMSKNRMAPGGPPPAPAMCLAAGGPPPPRAMRLAEGGPPPPPPPQAMYFAAGGPPPPPQAMSLDMSLSSSSDDSMEVSPALKSRSIAEKSSESLSRHVATAPVTLSSIIGAQQADGSWKLNESLARFVNQTLQEVETGCPTECKGVVATVWATLLILELLHTKYEDDEDEWELVGAKAESWTKKQNLPGGVTLGELRAAATKMLA